MDSRLLLPATPALLDGWCGPVVFAGEGGPLVPGVVISRMHDGRYLCWSDQAGLEWVAHTDLRFDLARAECRDRVARELACKQSDCAGYCAADGASWAQAWDDLPHWILTAPGRGNGAHAWSVTWLLDVDPHDDTRLPDGSRLVDALALAAVAR